MSMKPDDDVEPLLRAPSEADVRPADDKKHAPVSLAPKKILFLDGLRGLAAIMVVISHTGQSRISPGPAAVDIFFVLSAFLLTSGFEHTARRLLASQASRRRWALALAEYAVRRFLRVYPLFAIVAVYVSTLDRDQQVLMYDVRGGEFVLWKTLLFVPGNRWFVFWTLPLEIAYYFVIPFFVVAMLRLGKHWWVPLVPLSLVIVYAGIVTERWWYQQLRPHFLTFVTGSITGICYNRTTAWMHATGFQFTWKSRLLLRTVEYTNLVLFVSLTFEGLAFSWLISNPVPQTPGVHFVHANIAIVLFCEMLLQGSLASVLEWSVLRYAGQISFSMYLLHSFFSLNAWVWAQDSEYDWFVALWGSVFAASTLSFQLVERPCLALANSLSLALRRAAGDEIVLPSVAKGSKGLLP